MADISHIFALLIILLFSNTGSRALDTVFVKRGDSVQLDIPTDERSKINILFWQKILTPNISIRIVIYTISNQDIAEDSSYKGRVNFNPETFSLTVKNMQKTDSGLYTASEKLSRDTIVHYALYRVSVIDEVKTPNLTVVSNQSSSDSCAVNFTCSAHDLTLSSSYKNEKCLPEKVTSPENYIIILSCSEKSIICNHSNPVSWKTDETDIKQLCNKKTLNSPVNDKGFQPLLLVCILGSLLAVTLVTGLFIWKFRKSKNSCCKGDEQDVQTVYEQVEPHPLQSLKSDTNTYSDVSNQAHRELETNRPCTTYCTVGQHLSPSVTMVTDQTIYSQVYKPTKKPPTTSSNDPSNQTENHGLF